MVFEMDFGSSRCSTINYPKVENSGLDFLQDTNILRNLLFTIQQAAIMQVLLNAKRH